MCGVRYLHAQKIRLVVCMAPARTVNVRCEVCVLCLHVASQPRVFRLQACARTVGLAHAVTFHPLQQVRALWSQSVTVLLCYLTPLYVGAAVHVVQSCHLDVGFAESAPDIVNLWFDHQCVPASAVPRAVPVQSVGVGCVAASPWQFKSPRN